MLRPNLSAALLVLATFVLPACTDWDEPIGSNIAVSNDPRAAADIDPTGFVWWDTVSSGVDAGATADATAEDATTSQDAFTDQDALVVEILGEDAFAGDDATFDVAPDGADAGQDGLIAPDGVLDVPVLSDAVDPCAGAIRPIGCPCTASQQCSSGLCVNGPSGLVCSPGCKDVVCPAGWVCSAPTMVCKLVADVSDVQGAVDAVQGEISDTADLADAIQADAADTSDLPDAFQADAADTSDLPDAIQADIFDTSNLTDAIQADVADAVPIDTPIANDLTGPDWQGYPDANFPDDADIYGGAINSCLSLYLYQQETCSKNNPTAACIDDVAKQGSLYANYLFEPVRACQDAYCVDQCATASDETCMNQCIGKNCANQFLSCVSNDQQGTADCKTTFSCAMGYPGKLLTIGAKCYANGTLSAQLQVGGLIACETKPNTDSCFQAVGDCYDQGALATNTCMQTITCTQNCGSNQECVWTCLGKAAPAARKAVDALGDCMVTVCAPKCNGDQNCQNSCLSTDCSAQFSGCISN
jgi:hypothetical protein